MSETVELMRNYKEIRDRLRRPANAVEDKGISLKRIPLNKEQKQNTPKSKEVLDDVIGDILSPVLRCRVSVFEIPRSPLEKRSIKIPEIIKAVCGYFQTTHEVITGKCREARPCLIRHVTFYLAWTHTELSLPEIGRRLGGRDHSTVLNGRNKIMELLLVNEPLAQAVKAIEASLLARTYEKSPDQLRPAVAAQPERDMAQGPGADLPKPEICPVD